MHHLVFAKGNDAHLRLASDLQQNQAEASPAKHSAGSNVRGIHGGTVERQIHNMAVQECDAAAANHNNKDGGLETGVQRKHNHQQVLHERAHGFPATVCLRSQAF
jgi:recombination DNA repair RAD52 pathway protein